MSLLVFFCSLSFEHNKVTQFGSSLSHRNACGGDLIQLLIQGNGSSIHACAARDLSALLGVWGESPNLGKCPDDLGDQTSKLQDPVAPR